MAESKRRNMEKIEISPNLFRGLDIRGASEQFVKSQHFPEGSLKSKSAFGNVLNVEIAYVIGRAIAVTEKPKKIAVGYDKYDLGILTTASHAIKELNGFKISKYLKGRVLPVADGTGMEELKKT